MTRVQSDEVRLMAVMGIPVVPVIVPFVQVALMSDDVGMQARQGGFDLFHERQFLADFTCCCPHRVGNADTLHTDGIIGVGQQFTDDGKVGSTAVAGRSVVASVGLVFILWRGTWRSNQLCRILRVFNQPVEHELRGALHQWEGRLPQEVAVLSKQIVVPQILCEPGTAHVPVAPFRTLSFLAHGIGHRPDVTVVTGTPSVIDAVVVLCRIFPVFSQSLHESP